MADAMSKGEIGADKFVEAIVKATSKNGQFFEGASKQSDTLAGKFSTFVDNVETFAQNLGKIFEDPLKEILDFLNEIAGEFNKLFSMLGDAQIGASNRQVGSAVFKARLGMQDDAVRDIEKAVNLLDPAFVRTEEDAAKLAAQIERIQKAITLIRGADSLQVLEGRGLAEPLIDATLMLDEIKRKGLENVKAQKQLTIEAKKTNDAQKTISNTIDKNKNLIDLTSFAFTEGLVPDSGLFAQNLDLSNVFLSDMTNSSVDISAFFKEIKTDAELVKEKFAEIGDTIGVGISDALVAAINGTKSLAESARSILNDLANTFLRLGINSLLKMTGFGIFSNLSSFAKGGSPPVGRPSIVGEKGPEIFVPRSAGTIIANDKISGSGVVNNINISVDATGSSVEGDEGQAAQLGKAISQAIQAELVQQKRQGGLLYS